MSPTNRRRFSMPMVEGGPPAPISLLHRGVSTNTLEVDTNDPTQGGTDGDSNRHAVFASSGDSKEAAVSAALPQGRGEPATKKRKQESPARERPSEGQPWPYRDTLSFTRSLIFYGSGSITLEHVMACKSIQKCRSFRKKYCGQEGVKVDRELLKDITGNSSLLSYQFGADGVVEVYHESCPTKNICAVPNIQDFVEDYGQLAEMSSDGAMRSFCFQRLQLLSTAFKMHTTMNTQVETEEQSNLLGTDFYRTMKIDNHIHAAAANSAKQFVDFVSNKLETEGDVVVLANGKTLREVYNDAGLEKDHLTIDAFNVLADYSVYQVCLNYCPVSLYRMCAIAIMLHVRRNKLNGMNRM